MPILADTHIKKRALYSNKTKKKHTNLQGEGFHYTQCMLEQVYYCNNTAPLSRESNVGR